MALNSCLISIVVFFFVLSTFPGEAHQNANPPEAVKKPAVQVHSTKSVNANEKSNPPQGVKKPMVQVASTTSLNAHKIPNPPEVAKKPMVQVSSTLSANAPESSECAKKDIKDHMQKTADKTREFLMQDIRKRLNDRSTGEADRKCLMTCFQAYQNSGESIARGITHISEDEYLEAVKDVGAYSQDIAPCFQCTTETSVLKDAEFMDFQKWATNSGKDLHKKLKSCNQ